MSIIHSAQRRYAAKSFDPSQPLSTEDIATLKEILRLSPSSINYQGWHFIGITSEQAKEKLVASCHSNFSYNAKKVADAPFVVLCCAHTEARPEHVGVVLDREYADGRFTSAAAKAEREAMICASLEKLNQQPDGQVQAWLDKQVFLAVGQVLLAAADMEIDSIAIEGFDKAIADEAFNLAEQGYHSCVIVAFGHRNDDDFNAALPKSRLPIEDVYTEL